MSSYRVFAQRGKIVPYAMAVILPFAILIVLNAFLAHLSDRPLLILFVSPVICCALIGGLGPGLLCTAVVGGIVAFLLKPPFGHFDIGELSDFIPWLLLIGNCVLVTVMAELLHRARLAAMKDITERRQLEEESLVNKAKLEAALSSMSDAVFISDVDGRLIHVNNAVAAFHRFKSKEECSEKLSDYVNVLDVYSASGEKLPLEQWAVSRALRGEAATGAEFTLRRRDTGEVWAGSYAFAPIRDKNGAIAGAVVSGRDITDSKRKAALLELLESLARATNEAATPEAGMQTCLERICSYGNWPIGHVGLYAPNQSDGLTPVSIWRCADHARFAEFTREIEGFLRNKTIGNFLGLATREHRPVWIADLAAVEKTDLFRIARRFGISAGFVIPIFVDGKIAGFLEFFDIEVRERDYDLLNVIDGVASQLARLIERSRAASALAGINAELEVRVAVRTGELEMAVRELNTFSYTIAHDLRTPLRAINGYSSIVLAKNESKFDAITVGHLKRIIAGSEHMGQLIEGLLDMARLSRQALRRTDLNLSELATEVLNTLIQAHSARNVAVTIEPNLSINGDPDLMRALLDNLIGNAWKYSLKTSQARIEIGAERCNGQHVYFIRDNGVGFDMKYARKLFTAFQRLHQREEFEGTGIGLATVKKIIERHNGKVWIESAVNRGTTVFFTIGTAI